ncbi:hypothetical protein ACHAXT_007832 [Thalassiosira profunda]
MIHLLLSVILLLLFAVTVESRLEGGVKRGLGFNLSNEQFHPSSKGNKKKSTKRINPEVCPTEAVLFFGIDEGRRLMDVNDDFHPENGCHYAACDEGRRLMDMNDDFHTDGCPIETEVLIPKQDGGRRMLKEKVKQFKCPPGKNKPKEKCKAGGFKLTNDHFHPDDHDNDPLNLEDAELRQELNDKFHAVVCHYCLDQE